MPLHFKSIAQARVDIFRRLRQVGINPQWTPDPYGGLDTETLVEVPGFAPIRVRAATRYERSRQVAVRAMRQGIIVIEK